MIEKDFYDALEAAGHELIRNENGKVNQFVLDVDNESFGGHNGPGCRRCGESWCQHCNNEIEECKDESLYR